MGIVVSRAVFVAAVAIAGDSFRATGAGSIFWFGRGKKSQLGSNVKAGASSATRTAQMPTCRLRTGCRTIRNDKLASSKMKAPTASDCNNQAVNGS
jgi:hypothetical protein